MGSTWKKAPTELVARFDATIAEIPVLERRPMFGYPAAFANGHLVTGLFEDRWMVRLPDDAMAEDNVELVHLAVDATNRRDLATLDAIVSEQGEFHSTFAASEGRVFRGREGVRDYFATLGEAFDDVRVEIEEITDAGEDRLVVVVRVTGRGKGSGANVEQRNGQVWRFADGRIARIDSYLNPTDAFDAAAVGRGGFEPPTDGL